MSYQRRTTNVTHVGHIEIGGTNPIRIQSMATTDTNDTAASVAQAKRIIDAGGELVRFTTQGTREAENMQHISAQLKADGYDTPLVADVHFTAHVADVAAQYCEKVRINPGNYVDPGRVFKHLEYTDAEYAAELQKIEAKLVPFLHICKQHHTAIRIGVNHGSLSDRIMSRYGDTPEGIVESCMEFLRICKREQFHDIVISIKASNTVVMVTTVRLLVQTMDREDMHYPLHLGVTEAGEGEDGRIKSAVGIGTLLAEGIGDTIRVSLSEEPEAEIPVAQAILQACGIGRYKTEFVSCPSCGRTMFDLPQTVRDIKAAIAARPDLDALHLKIGIMGCIVNGPGEMAGADYGYVGAGKGQVSLYRGQECVLKHIPQAQAVDKLLELMERGKLKAERGKLKVESSIQKSEISIK